MIAIYKVEIRDIDTQNYLRMYFIGQCSYLSFFQQNRLVDRQSSYLYGHSHNRYLKTPLSVLYAQLTKIVFFRKIDTWDLNVTPEVIQSSTS